MSESSTPQKFNSPFGLILLNGVFLFIDRYLKWQAQNFPDWVHLIFENFGWQPFFNRGIAFGIRIPPGFIIFLSLIIVIAVIFLFFKEWKEQKNYYVLLGLSLIFSGAFSNLTDRLLYRGTIDYFRIFTGVINIADCLIITGFVIYFVSLKKISD